MSALSAGSQRFIFEGREIRLEWSCGIFITMNPGNILTQFHFHLFIHSFIHSRIYKAPLQEICSEVPPAQPRRYRSVLSNLQNALSLFLGRIQISKGSPFQVE